MNTQAFTIYYVHQDVMNSVEIRPCCGDDNVVDYAVWEEDRLAFTITKNEQEAKWIVALKNADDKIDDELVQLIGTEIEKRNTNQQ